MTTTIPTRLTGEWTRNYIKRGDAAPQTDVVVRYLQTPSLFFDIRIGGDAADTMSFAGLSRWHDDKQEVHWHAAFNSAPPADDTAVWTAIANNTHETEDFGRVEFTDENTWLEYGEGYLEEWSRSAEQTPHALHLSAIRPGCMVVVVGHHFGFASSLGKEQGKPQSFCYGSTEDWKVKLSVNEAYKVGDAFELPGEKQGWVVSQDSTMDWPF